MSEMAQDVIAERLKGGRPGVVRSVLVAAGAGFATAALTYRLLRSG